MQERAKQIRDWRRVTLHLAMQFDPRIPADALDSFKLSNPTTDVLGDDALNQLARYIPDLVARYRRDRAFEGYYDSAESWGEAALMNLAAGDNEKATYFAVGAATHARLALGDRIFDAEIL